MGEGTRSSTLVPAGSSFTSAARGSAAACESGVSAGACALAWPRTPASAKTAITHTLLNIEHSGENTRYRWTARQAAGSPGCGLTARMMLRVQILEALACDVRVDLRGGKIAVPQEH